MKLKRYMREVPSKTCNPGLLASVLLIILLAIGSAFADKNGTAGGTDIPVIDVDRCPCCLSDYGFDQENSSIWIKSNWMNNDKLYLNTWISDPSHNRIKDGNLYLNLDNQPCSSDKSQCQGQDLASGEYSTKCDQYRYGNLSGKILAGKGEGILTGMFLLGGTVGKQDEIDVEIFGKDAVKPGSWEIQTNYFVNGSQGDCDEPYGLPEPCHVAIIPLDFDPTQSYHMYNISWIGKGEKCSGIKWYIDGKLRRSVWKDSEGYIQSNVFDEKGKIIGVGDSYKGNLPSNKSKIFLSLWAAQNWPQAGDFNYGLKKPILAKIDWIKYSPLESS